MPSAIKINSWLRWYAENRLNSYLIDERRSIPPGLVLEFGKKGLLGLTIPKKFGGLELPASETMAVFRQLGAIDLSLATFVANASLAQRTIMEFASEDVINSYLKGLAKGRFIASFAMTESGAGSDLGKISSSAQRVDASRWLLSGEKRWIGSASWSELLCVFAKAKDGDSDMGMTGFVVPCDAAGVSFGNESDTVGMRGLVQSSIKLQEVAIDSKHLLGSVGQGSDIAQSGMMFNRLVLSAIALGGIERSLQLIYNYASKREISTGILLDNINIREKISDIIYRKNIVQCAVEKIAQELDKKEKIPPEILCSIKVFSSETLSMAADLAVQVLGARGYEESNVAAKIYRDSRIFRVFEGATETLNHYVGALSYNTPKDLERYVKRSGAGELDNDIVAKFKESVNRACVSNSESEKDSISKDWLYLNLGELVCLYLMKVLTSNKGKQLENEARYLAGQIDNKFYEIAQYSKKRTLTNKEISAEIQNAFMQLGNCEQKQLGLKSTLDEIITSTASNNKTSTPTVNQEPHKTSVDINESKTFDNIDTWNDIEIDFSGSMLLHKNFENYARIHPENVAVTFRGNKLTYADLNKVSSHLSIKIREKTNNDSKQVVAIIMDRGFEIVESMLGVLKSGNIYLPIDPSLPKERIRYILEDSSASLTLTTKSVLSEYQLGDVEGAVCINDLKNGECEDNADFKEVSISENDPAYLIYTSGSTGNPKGALLPHYGPVNFIKWLEESFFIDSQDKVLWKANVSFDHSVWECFLPLSVGGELIIAEPGSESASEKIVELVSQQKVTVAQFVPTMLRLFLDVKNVASCEDLRFVMAGGEALPLNLIEQFYSKLESSFLCNCYGPTEASIGVTMWPCSRGEVNEVPIGRPIPNVKIHILDEYDRPVVAGQGGEICIEGSLALGYFGKPDITSQRFISLPDVSSERLYRTGDRGKWREDGNILYLGRIDNQVKVRGNRVELEEVELAVNGYSGIACSLATVQKDKYSNTQLVIYYKTIGPESKLDLVNVRRYLKERVPEFMVPSKFYEVEDFYFTPNGKIDRKAEPIMPPDRDEDTAHEGYESDAVLLDIKASLKKIYENVLDDTVENTDISFTDLGGNSLLALELVAQINEKYEKYMSDFNLGHLSIDRVSEHISSNMRCGTDIPN